MSGTITGGWGFVWAAYGLSAFVFVTYAISLVTRLGDERRLNGVSEKSR